MHDAKKLRYLKKTDTIKRKINDLIKERKLFFVLREKIAASAPYPRERASAMWTVLESAAVHSLHS